MSGMANVVVKNLLKNVKKLSTKCQISCQKVCQKVVKKLQKITKTWQTLEKLFDKGKKQIDKT
jgi:predicted secreted Zn-dependent protease